MRTSVRRTTTSSQTTSGTTRTTCSSPSTTPMTVLTSTVAWCTPCVERARRAHSSTLLMTPHTSLAHVLSKHFVIHGHTHGAFSLIRPLSFFFFFSFLSFSVYFLHNELFLELDNPIIMASLRYSASEKSEGTFERLTPSQKFQLLSSGSMNQILFSFRHV